MESLRMIFITLQNHFSFPLRFSLGAYKFITATFFGFLLSLIHNILSLHNFNFFNLTFMLSHIIKSVPPLYFCFSAYHIADWPLSILPYTVHFSYFTTADNFIPSISLNNSLLFTRKFLSVKFLFVLSRSMIITVL